MRQRSCAPCAAAKRSCDHENPCGRCKMLGIQQQCVILPDMRKAEARQAASQAASQAPPPRKRTRAASAQRSRDEDSSAAYDAGASDAYGRVTPAALFSRVEMLARTNNLAMNLLPAFPYATAASEMAEVERAFTAMTLLSSDSSSGGGSSGSSSTGSSNSSDLSSSAIEGTATEAVFDRITLEALGASSKPLMYINFLDPDAVTLRTGGPLRVRMISLNTAMGALLGIPVGIPPSMVLQTLGPQYIPAHVHPEERLQYLRELTRAVMLRLPHMRSSVRVLSTTGYVRATEELELNYRANGCLRAIFLTMVDVDMSTLQPYGPEYYGPMMKEGQSMVLRLRMMPTGAAEAQSAPYQFQVLSQPPLPTDTLLDVHTDMLMSKLQSIVPVQELCMVPPGKMPPSAPAIAAAAAAAAAAATAAAASSPSSTTAPSVSSPVAAAALEPGVIPVELEERMKQCDATLDNLRAAGVIGGPYTMFRRLMPNGATSSSGSVSAAASVAAAAASPRSPATTATGVDTYMDSASSVSGSIIPDLLELDALEHSGSGGTPASVAYGPSATARGSAAAAAAAAASASAAPRFTPLDVDSELFWSNPSALDVLYNSVALDLNFEGEDV